VLGIAKAYTTRVGSGPFPTELFDETGLRLATVGKEFGSVTGRPRRCGWFDAVAMRRSIQLNGVSGLCVTKLDVLDGLPSVKICTGYLCGDEPVDLLPFGAEDVATCVPVYEEMPGWSTTTFGARSWDVLPPEAQRYLQRLSELVGAPIDMVSTGPDRDETILLRHPFPS
jgi:adenylosuccinate synthase